MGCSSSTIRSSRIKDKKILFTTYHKNNNDSLEISYQQLNKHDNNYLCMTATSCLHNCQDNNYQQNELPCNICNLEKPVGQFNKQINSYNFNRNPQILHNTGKNNLKQQQRSLSYDNICTNKNLTNSYQLKPGHQQCTDSYQLPQLHLSPTFRQHKIIKIEQLGQYNQFQYHPQEKNNSKIQIQKNMFKPSRSCSDMMKSSSRQNLQQSQNNYLIQNQDQQLQYFYKPSQKYKLVHEIPLQVQAQQERLSQQILSKLNQPQNLNKSSTTQRTSIMQEEQNALQTSNVVFDASEFQYYQLNNMNFANSSLSANPTVSTTTNLNQLLFSPNIQKQKDFKNQKIQQQLSSQSIATNNYTNNNTKQQYQEKFSQQQYQYNNKYNKDNINQQQNNRKSISQQLKYSDHQFKQLNTQAINDQTKKQLENYIIDFKIEIPKKITNSKISTLVNNDIKQIQNDHQQQQNVIGDQDKMLMKQKEFKDFQQENTHQNSSLLSNDLEQKVNLIKQETGIDIFTLIQNTYQNLKSNNISDLIPSLQEKLLQQQFNLEMQQPNIVQPQQQVKYESISENIQSITKEQSGITNSTQISKFNVPSDVVLQSKEQSQIFQNIQNEEHYNNNQNIQKQNSSQKQQQFISINDQNYENASINESFKSQQSIHERLMNKLKNISLENSKTDSNSLQISNTNIEGRQTNEINCINLDSGDVKYQNLEKKIENGSKVLVNISNQLQHEIDKQNLILQQASQKQNFLTLQSKLGQDSNRSPENYQDQSQQCHEINDIQKDQFIHQNCDKENFLDLKQSQLSISQKKSNREINENQQLYQQDIKINNSYVEQNMSIINKDIISPIYLLSSDKSTKRTQIQNIPGINNDECNEIEEWSELFAEGSDNKDNKNEDIQLFSKYYEKAIKKSIHKIEKKIEIASLNLNNINNDFEYQDINNEIYVKQNNIQQQGSQQKSENKKVVSFNSFYKDALQDSIKSIDQKILDIKIYLDNIQQARKEVKKQLKDLEQYNLQNNQQNNDKTDANKININDIKYKLHFVEMYRLDLEKQIQLYKSCQNKQTNEEQLLNMYDSYRVMISNSFNIINKKMSCMHSNLLSCQVSQQSLQESILNQNENQICPNPYINSNDHVLINTDV